jgi:glycosyltransferase involved in cell wall biosynthesis
VTRLLVDGIFFQLNNTGIARVWFSVLGYLVQSGRFQVYFLDRGNAPKIPGVEYLPFPSFTRSASAADSQLIQDVCDELHIDVFTSTYYSTPLTTPMLLMVYDMIPELFDFDMSHRPWQEKITAISYAQRYLCISENTRADLLKIYPEIPPSHAAMAHCGVDDAVFRLRDAADVEAFRRQQGLDRPYFLFVGSRVQHMGYKNCGRFFNALARMGSAQFDVFCVGGEREIERSILDALPHGVRCRRVELTDDELALAYGGALALVYPSLYEGFGMPVIEAMAAGCPVITTHHGSLAEAAGDAAMLISGESVDEMRAALLRMQDPQVRATLREKGLAHVREFRWEDMARELALGLEKLVAEARAGTYDAFFAEWARLRQLQANVDHVAP